MIKTTSTSAGSENIVGITQHCVYILSASRTSLPQHFKHLQIQWLTEREAFFFKALQGCNLLLNSDFGDYRDQCLSGWEMEAHNSAAVGVDFSDKWRLSGGHTAFLFAPTESPRPVLRLTEAIPLISDAAFNYRLSGFFGTHRADGMIKIDFFDINDVKLGSQTFRVYQSDQYPGGLSPENYRYMHWTVRATPGATRARLQISMGQHKGAGLPDSFLFISHLFFGVEDKNNLSVWSPFSAGAYQLSSYSQHRDWQAFGIALLPPTHEQQKIEFTIDNESYSFMSENTAVPEYLTAAVIDTSAHSIDTLFDPQFYVQSDHNMLNIDQSDELLNHYQTIGWRINRSPSPYFDVAWYRINNPEIRDQDIEPLQHFIDTGSAAHRSPHPLFDAHWYYQTYLAETQTTTHPLFHYISEGWRLGYHPHPLFWTRWYEQHYLGNRAGTIDPFYHFITDGWRNNCNPNPLFDTQHYLKEYAAKSRIEPDPLSHYVHVGWHENYQPHILFDPNYYAMQTGFNIQLAKTSPLEEFLVSTKPVSPHPLFDAVFYLEQVGSELNQQPLLDYLERGWHGGIDPNPMFSKSYYYRHAQQAKNERVDALMHYLESGWKNKQPVHPLFDAQYYLEQNPKAHGCIPLQHYLVHGWHNGYSCRPTDVSNDQNQKKLTEARTVLCIPDDYLLPINTDNTQEDRRIGVFAHIFYPDLAAEMIAATNNIPGHCTLFISTDTLGKIREISAVCQQLSKHPFEIRMTPNRGRDIATMLCGFRDRFQDVDYGVHIHSKRSSHFDEEFADTWRQHLIEGNLGSEILVRNILNVLSDEKIGAYAPEHYEPIRPLIQWTGNFATVKKLLELCGEDISKDHNLDFPSGSMFWFKTKALKPLMDLNLRAYHFEAEQGQTDNTLAHAIERSFFYFVETAGYAWVIGRKVQGATSERAVADIKAANSSTDNFANRIFPTNRELGRLRNHFSQCTRFLARPSLIKKNRLNLLLPTLNIGQGHIDTKTALELFSAIRRALGADFDARIITTDISPEHHFHPPKGYQICSPQEKDQVDVDVIVDAAQRFRYPFFVRDTDVFVATSWWTASNVIDMLKQQDRLFGQRQRSFVYFIQDVESSFYPWSSQFALAEQTYQHPEKTIPVFSTHFVYEHFNNNGYFNNGHIAYPLMNPAIKKAVRVDTPKEKIVLLYTKPNTERNCLPFLDVLVQTVIDADPAFWLEWRFIAFGDNNISSNAPKIAQAIEVLGQLTTQEYGELASRAALAISLMISPHPSYPPLEMAGAGVLVLTNSYADKDLSLIHDNISSFDVFDVDSVAEQFRMMAEKWSAQPELGWLGKPKVDWFYGETSNFDDIGTAIALDIIEQLP